MPKIKSIKLPNRLVYDIQDKRLPEVTSEDAKKSFVVQDDGSILLEKQVEEAPEDNKKYVRTDALWEELSAITKEELQEAVAEGIASSMGYTDHMTEWGEF